jgi:hypothetical protein
VAQATQLEELNLGATRFGERENELIILSFTNEHHRVTLDGVTKLAALPKLQRLHLEDCGLSKEAAAKVLRPTVSIE